MGHESLRNATKRGTHVSKQRTSPREVVRATPSSTQPLLELPRGTREKKALICWPYTSLHAMGPRPPRRRASTHGAQTPRRRLHVSRGTCGHQPSSPTLHASCRYGFQRVIDFSSSEHAKRLPVRLPPMITLNEKMMTCRDAQVKRNLAGDANEIRQRNKKQKRDWLERPDSSNPPFEVHMC